MIFDQNCGSFFLMEELALNSFEIKLQNQSQEDLCLLYCYLFDY